MAKKHCNLRNMKLFELLNETELRQVEKTLKKKHFKKGARIIDEGDKTESIYLVASGELNVCRTVRGKARELATFRAGDHFGEVSFIDGKPRSASIVANCDSELLLLSRSAFDQLLTKHPRLQSKLSRQLLENLCDKLRNRNDALDFEMTDLLPVSVFEADRHGKLTFSNRSGLDAFGYTDEDFQNGMSVAQLVTEKDRKKMEQHIRKLLRGKAKMHSEFTALRKNGTEFPVLAQWDLLKKDQQNIGTRLTLVDITRQKEMESTLRKMQNELEIRVQERTVELADSRERYAIAAEGSQDGLWDWNLGNNEIYFSPRWKSMLGYDDRELSNASEEWFQRIHPEDLDALKSAISLHLEGMVGHIQVEHRVMHKDGNYRWMLCRGIAVRDAQQKPYRIAGSQTDITERKRMEHRLVHDAFYDSLTGLPNRALFLDRVGMVLERAKQRTRRDKEYYFAVLFLDLDRFKNVNDSLGHASGDKLLTAVASRITGCIRPGDAVARLGGDEFAVLLDQVTGAADAIIVSERIQSTLAFPFELNGSQVFVGASIGIAFGPNCPGSKAPSLRSSYSRPEEMLRDADTAMYRAKAQGKACYEIFDREMHDRAVIALQLETDLRWAIEREEYRVHYQPIVSMKTARIVGFETLARWQHPERGLVPPAEFIPIAEDTGIIVPLGRAILKQACKQIQQFNQEHSRDFPMFVSVNVSPRQLLYSNFVEQVRQSLDESGLPPHLLKLEITESMMMDGSEATRTLLCSLKTLGLQLVVDDFGTGYSSLSNLHRYPIDALKIDRSFVRNIGTQADKLQIVNTILALARTLRMEVIAEGIEKAGDLERLRELKCEFGQGYYFGKPAENLTTEPSTGDP